MRSVKLPIDKYLKVDLLDELGIKNLEPEERVQFLEKIGEALQYKLATRIMQELNPEQKDHLEKLMDEEPFDGEALRVFFEVAFPQFDAIAKEEVAAYKHELIQRYKA